ncbi:hypothetical protein ACFVMC_28240 [Nocardia sp. NPDC127579]|uniref:hypothetical protein n=1 Tax=Nocardia sp. NPDC127579 TaxID=3345402 RepID=UPI00362D6923
MMTFELGQQIPDLVGILDVVPDEQPSGVRPQPAHRPLGENLRGNAVGSFTLQLAAHRSQRIRQFRTTIGHDAPDRVPSTACADHLGDGCLTDPGRADQHPRTCGIGQRLGQLPDQLTAPVDGGHPRPRQIADTRRRHNSFRRQQVQPLVLDGDAVRGDVPKFDP